MMVGVLSEELIGFSQERNKCVKMFSKSIPIASSLASKHRALSHVSRATLDDSGGQLCRAPSSGALLISPQQYDGSGLVCSTSIESDYGVAMWHWLFALPLRSLLYVD